MISENLLPKGMVNSYNGDIICDMEELLEGEKSLPVDFLVDYSNKEHYYEDFLHESSARQFDMNIRKKKPVKMVPINEMTQKEILRGADYKRRARAKKLTTKYIGVTPKKGWIKFMTYSQYLPGVKYIQYIELKEAKDIKYFKEFKKQDIIRLFMQGDIRIFCQCPDFRYRFSYMTYQMGYGLKKENRFPKIVNPNLEGSCCKHLIVVLSSLMFNWSKIAKDMRKTKFFNINYSEDDYQEEIDKEKQRAKDLRKKKSKRK